MNVIKYKKNKTSKRSGEPIENVRRSNRKRSREPIETFEDLMKTFLYFKK